MIPKLESAETLRTLALVVGGMKNLHVLFKESGIELAYPTLSRYISNNAQFDSEVFRDVFKTIKEGKSFTAREALRNLEDTYIVLNELVAQGVLVPRKMGEASEVDKDWEKRQTLTNEEIKEMEEEFGMKLSKEQKDVLKGKRKSLPKSSRSIDDLFDDDEPYEKAVDLGAPEAYEKEEAEELLEEKPEPVEEKKPEKKKSFDLEGFLNEAPNEPPPQSSLTEDPFESGLRKTQDVFTAEEHRI